jgi:hypothetical protein
MTHRLGLRRMSRLDEVGTMICHGSAIAMAFTHNSGCSQARAVALAKSTARRSRHPYSMVRGATSQKGSALAVFPRRRTTCLFQWPCARS